MLGDVNQVAVDLDAQPMLPRRAHECGQRRMQRGLAADEPHHPHTEPRALADYAHPVVDRHDSVIAAWTRVCVAVCALHFPDYCAVGGSQSVVLGLHNHAPFGAAPRGDMSDVREKSKLTPLKGRPPGVRAHDRPYPRGGL